MRRREFLEIAAATLAASGRGEALSGTSDQVVTERSKAGQPHQGKVLALVTPHLDDGPIFAGGTLAKLLSEGYTGYFIRTSNDERDSYHLSLGETDPAFQMLRPSTRETSPSSGATPRLIRSLRIRH